MNEKGPIAQFEVPPAIREQFPMAQLDTPPSTCEYDPAVETAHPIVTFVALTEIGSAFPLPSDNWVHDVTAVFSIVLIRPG
jgi:hypothetical protein